MPAKGSLATLGVGELLQMAALFRKWGSLRLLFPGGRLITVYFEDGSLSGLTDTGREWQLGQLLSSLGRLSELDKQHLLTDSLLRGKRLGQLAIDQGVVTRAEVEDLLRRLILQSLLWAAEHAEEGEFELNLGAVSQTTVRFPMVDFLIEVTAASDESRRLKELLGPGEGSLVARQQVHEGQGEALSFRQVQVLAHVDGEKSPTDIVAVSPFGPAETLHILSDLAAQGVVSWAAPIVVRRTR